MLRRASRLTSRPACLLAGSRWAVATAAAKAEAASPPSRHAQRLAGRQDSFTAGRATHGLGNAGSGPRPLALDATHRCTVDRCTPSRAATSVTPAPSRTARTASRRCSITDKTTSANPGLPARRPRKRRTRVAETRPLSQITWRKNVARQSTEDTLSHSLVECRIAPYLDQGGTATRRRWLGVSAALRLRRHARRTPSRSCESPPDQHSSSATQTRCVLLDALPWLGRLTAA